MTPTLLGRLQTRVVLLATVGLGWTALVTLLLPQRSTDSLGGLYGVTLRALLVVIVVGILWEFVYHGLQQFRWEKDWPTLFGLLVGVNEGLIAWFVLRAVFDVDPTVTQYAIHFITTWIAVWLFANGPMRVVALRWRFHGGRLL